MANKAIFETKPELLKLAIKLAKMGLYQKTVADWIGVSEDTMTRSKAKHPELADAFESGTATARGMCIQKLIEKVQAGNVQAIKYYMTMICGMSEKQEIEQHTQGDINISWTPLSDTPRTQGNNDSTTVQPDSE